MSNKYSKDDSPAGPLKNESARARWELFHRAIAHAKASSNPDQQELDAGADEPPTARPLLTIVR